MAAIALAIALIASACGDDDTTTTTTTIVPTGPLVTDPPSTTSAPATTVPEFGEVSSLELGLGDCFNQSAAQEAEPTAVTTVERVDCAEPHDNEVYDQSVFPGESPTYPGADVLERVASFYCLDRFEQFVGIPYSESVFTISSLWPSDETWEELEDRTIQCLLFEKDEQRRGTAKGSEQ